MADAPTHGDLLAIARAEMLANNSLLDVDVLDIEGHPAHILANVNAALASEVVRQVVAVERQMFIDTASGTDLDRLVYDRYALTRLEAAPSRGTVQLSRPTAAYGAISVAAGTVLVSTSGIRFELVEPADFGGGATGPITANVRSVLAGAGQRASASTITAFETQPADATIVVTNAAATAGDADAETDPQLRERARRYFENAARGTLSAIEYGALQVPGIRFAVATEITTLSGEPARWVRLQVADRLGQSTAALTAEVEDALDDWRPAGMHVEVVGATVTYVTIAIALTVSSAFDTTSVEAAVKSAVVAALDGFAPSQTLHHSDIIAAAKAVAGVVDASVTLPVTAVAPATTEVLRTRVELVSIAST